VRARGGGRERETKRENKRLFKKGMGGK